MFIMSLRVNTTFKKILSLLLFLSLIGVIILFSINKNYNKQTQSKFDTAISLNGKTNKDRINFFKQFGWETASEPCEINDVSIPQKFDDVIEGYNELQKKQKLDLSKYKGKIVKHYSYEITNYPKHPENIRGNLLVYENQIIASDICSLELDGFMHEVCLNN
ncbi:MAG: DUF4830 domain-containing protein [Oscillospiraceae bacterium]|nr:DUF4830 domain-containing protein [Oscillospiraceae bacterium]